MRHPDFFEGANFSEGEAAATFTNHRFFAQPGSALAMAE